MLKAIIFGFLACIGIVLLFAVYAAYRITRMGRNMGHRGTPTTHHDYITTTGTTILDDSSSKAEQYADNDSNSDSGDSGGGDSGGGDSGGDGGSSD